jgi:hypothetical protein
MIQKANLHRKTIQEIDQAIDDLLKRGYTLITKKQLHSEGKCFTKDKYGHFSFKANSDSVCWYAQLEREVSNG